MGAIIFAPIYIKYDPLPNGYFQGDLHIHFLLFFYLLLLYLLVK